FRELQTLVFAKTEAFLLEINPESSATSSFLLPTDRAWRQLSPLESEATLESAEATPSNAGFTSTGCVTWVRLNSRVPWWASAG
ncbi:MAG: hypothetical protein WCL31_07870, partial [Actinomycetes bacterium]